MSSDPSRDDKASPAMTETSGSLVLFGALGGLAAALTNLANADFSVLIHAPVGFFVGYVIKVVITVGLGAFWTYIIRKEVSSILISFQIGMIPTLIINNVISASNYPVKFESSASPASNYVLMKYQRPLLWLVEQKSSTDANGSAFTQGLGFSGNPSLFILVLVCITGMSLFSAVLSVYLVRQPRGQNPNDQQLNNLIETFSTTWKLGFGAIIGLVSGKALG